MIYYPSWRSNKNMANVITGEETGHGHVVELYGELALDKQHLMSL